MKLKITKLKLCFCITVLSILAVTSLHAQYENVWVFGHGTSRYAGMGFNVDFNGLNPVASSIRLSAIGEGAASVCDTKGQLLFYTEGDTIWNKNGQVMPNGGGLTGLPRIFSGRLTATSSSTQGALIVPMPGDPDKYYVFSLTDNIAKVWDTIFGHLYYSVVDMKLNGGMGDVVSGKKGIFIDSGFAESVTGVAGDHCNVWVVAPAYSPITHKSDLFKVYEITENGLNRNPLTFNVGNGIADRYSQFGEFSNVKFSSDRKRLARSRWSSPDTNCLELYDFDPATGAISNRLNLDATSGMKYFSTCFSPDNSKLYAMCYQKNRLYQFDLSVYTRSSIDNSKILIDSFANSYDIKSGRGNKLYYFKKNSNTLKWISYPNKAGMACEPDTGISISIVELPVVSPMMFPNAVPVPRADTNYTVNHSTICSDEINLQPSDNNSLWFRWDDGSTNKTRNIAESGTYWVEHGNYCHYQVDSFVVNIEGFTSPVITTNLFELSTATSYDTYQWLLNGQAIGGATDSFYRVTENGSYTVIVTNENGCTDTSAVYEVTNYTDIVDIGSIAKDIHVYPNPAQDLLYISTPIKINVRLVGIEGKWIKDSQEGRSISLADVVDGIYLLHITDREGRLLKVEKIVKAR